MGAFPSEDGHTSALVKRVISVNWEIFFVESFVSDDLGLNLSDNREHVWLSIVIAVSADTQVAFAGIRIIFEISGQAENRIGRSSDNVTELVVDKSESLHSR